MKSIKMKRFLAILISFITISICMLTGGTGFATPLPTEYIVNLHTNVLDSITLNSAEVKASGTLTSSVKDYSIWKSRYSLTLGNYIEYKPLVGRLAPGYYKISHYMPVAGANDPALQCKIYHNNQVGNSVEDIVSIDQSRQSVGWNYVGNDAYYFNGSGDEKITLLKTAEATKHARFGSIKFVPVVYVANSTLTNGQADVNSLIPSVDITFSEDVSATAINTTNITLYDKDSMVNIDYNGSYHADTLTYTMNFDAGTFMPGASYQIKFNSTNIGNNSRGYSFNPSNTIEFTIKKPDVEISGLDGVKITDTIGANALMNLTGKTSLYANVSLKKNVADDRNVFVIIALYNANDVLISVNAQNRVITGSVGAIVNINDIGITSIAPLNGWYASVYVWDSLRHPLTKQAVEVEAN